MEYYEAVEATHWPLQDCLPMNRFNINEARRKLLKLGCERLEIRRVLDASALPNWDQMPEVAGRTLTQDVELTASANAQLGDFFYTTANGKVTITGYRGAGGAIEIPSLIEGLPVTAIGRMAFSRNGNLTSVTVPVSVTSVGEYAFEFCQSLLSVSLPDGMTNLSDFLFHYCSNLHTVTIPATVTRIGDQVFRDCSSLKTLSIPPQLQTIGDYAFYACSSLPRIDIPDSVLSIGQGKFISCRSMTDITVGPLNAAYMSIDGILYNKSGTTMIQCPAGRTGSVTIPFGVQRIETNGFIGCEALTSVTLPHGLTDIGQSAFSMCSSLASIQIPDTVIRIGYWAFELCGSLSSVTLPSRVSRIGYGTFMGCVNLTAVTLAYGLTTIDGSAFSSCSNLTTLSLPSSLTTIGGGAFGYCSSLKTIVIPASVTDIGSGAFASCQSLKSIAVSPWNPKYATFDDALHDKALTTLIQWPGGGGRRVVITQTVTTVAPFAFYNCDSIETLTIPASVVTIGERAISFCRSLSATYFVGIPPSLGPAVFSGTPVTAYRLSSATGWTSTFDGIPVEIFQPTDVPSGQKVVASIAADTSRVLKQGSGTAILSTASTRTGGTVVEAGELVVRHKDALGTGVLEVQAGARATFQTGYDTVAVTSLNLADTSRLELGIGKLSISANGFTESDIRTKLIAGRNGGSWDGASGITSTFAGGDRSIGYRVTDGALEVAYAAPGDSNLDGVFDILDIGDILSAGKFNTGAAANWTQGDTNYDNVFDIVDLADILGTGLFNEGTYLTQGSASSAAAETGTAAKFDSALVFAALAAEPSSQPTTKRKSF